MINIYIIRGLIKIAYVCLGCYFTYIKISDTKITSKKQTVYAVLSSALASIIYVLLLNILPAFFNILITLTISGTLVKIILKVKGYNFIVTYAISALITYLAYTISLIISIILLSILSSKLEYTSLIIIIVTMIIATIFLNCIFKIKRFKRGINFLKNEKINKNIIISTLVFCGFVSIIYSVLQRDDNSLNMTIILIIGLVLMSLGVFISVKNFITEHYKKHMRDRTIEMQKREIDEYLETIEHVKAENIRLATIIHKYNSRISALERSITKTMSNMNTEFAGELSIMLDETKGLSKEIEEQTKRNASVPSTGIYGIDNMFQFMHEECMDNEINFTLKITDNINYLIENVVKKEKLETLIGDHIKDAIIAINSGKPEHKSILCVMGIVRDSYEFSVYDTGIDFEIDTLLKLGIEQVTTHKDSGGSGIGFMTTFETMKECGASLIIEEYDKKTTHYTKSVTIRFDGKNEYKIYSYRHKEIKNASKDKRINIHDIE